MHIVHGTWIPEDTHEFIQRGAFYVWVETDTPPDTVSDAVHPRHLDAIALTTFLAERLGLRESPPERLETRYFLLPTVAGAPAASFELLRYVDEEEPLEFALVPWQVCCYRLPDVISMLNDIHFIALHAAEDFQLGADLVFWHQYAQALKAVIAKDQYIPALKYRELPSVAPVTAGKKAKIASTTAITRTRKAKNTAPSIEIYPAWELLSDIYEMNIQRYAAAMPPICAAGLSNPDGAALFDREKLLRHFSECLLHDIVTSTPFTAKFRS